MNRLERRVKRLERRLGLGKDGLPKCPVCRDGRLKGETVSFHYGEPQPVCRCAACGRELVPWMVLCRMKTPAPGTQLQPPLAKRRNEKTLGGPGS